MLETRTGEGRERARVCVGGGVHVCVHAHVRAFACMRACVCVPGAHVHQQPDLAYHWLEFSGLHCKTPQDNSSCTSTGSRNNKNDDSNNNNNKDHNKNSKLRKE